MDTMQSELLHEMTGYGRLVAFYLGERTIAEGDDTTGTRPLPASLAENYIRGLYAEVVSRPIAHLYRYYDTLPGESPDEIRRRPPMDGFAARRGAMLEGGWWSTRLPGIPQEDRRMLAISHDFNRMDWIVDASLAEGTRVYVGRAASQSDAFRGPWARLAGGAIQFYVPHAQAGALTRNGIRRVR